MSRGYPFLRAIAGITAWLGLATPAVAAATNLPPLVRDMGIGLLLASLLMAVFHRFRLPSIAAFLLAGIVAGPLGLDLISDRKNIDTIAGLGLVLLLFVIGLELDFRKLASSSKTLILSGILQFPLSVILGIAVGGLLLLSGVGILISSPDNTGYAMLYLGIIMATSSTLLVVQLFHTHFLMDTHSGRISVGLLIFQDIWIILIIALQPGFSNPGVAPVISAFAAIAVLITIAVALARYLLPGAFRWVAKTPGLVVVTSLGWCFGVILMGENLDAMTAWLPGLSNLQLTVGASMSALIAGACMASFPYSAELIGRVGLIKDFFIALFFVGLGLSIPMPDGPGVIWLAVLVAVLAVIARLVIFFPLLYWTGLDRRNAMVSSLRLAQISEFSLVICYAGLDLGHISAEFNTMIIFAFILTAVWTPLLFRHADTLYARMGKLLDHLGFHEPEAGAAPIPHKYSLALLGFHRLAASLLHEVARSYPEILESMLVVDFNVDTHKEIAEYGPTVRYADLANGEALQHVGVDRARVVLITLQNDLLVGTSNHKIIQSVKNMNPSACIIASAMEYREIEALYSAGADYVYLAHVESARGLAPAIASALEGKLDDYRSVRESGDEALAERSGIIN